MRFELNFILETPEINTLDYRRIFISIIKTALSKYHNGELLDKFYAPATTKDFSWTVLMEKPSFFKDKICLGGNRIKMIFSTGDSMGTGYHLFSAFIKIKNIKLPLPNGNSIRLISQRQLQQNVITGNSCIFKTMAGAPTLVREHNRENNTDKFYTVLDTDFDTKFTEMLKRQAEMAGYSSADIENISARAIQCEKTVIYSYGVYVDGNKGLIEIKANPEILQYFYQNSIGGHKSQGFGMLEVVAEKTDEGR